MAIFLCEELKHQRTESPIRPFIVFIVECLQVSLISIEMKYKKSEEKKREIFFLLKDQSKQRTSVEKIEHVSMLAVAAG